MDGSWQGEAFVVDRRWEPNAQHGRETVGLLADRLERGAAEASLFAAGAPRPPFVFFDLETTGLSGGAGTLAFLVGFGWFEADGAFRTRQFLLTRYADERLLLQAVAAEIARAGALVSFNGKSFDAPLLETRYLFHRLAWPGAALPHLDALHPARQFWKREGRPEGLHYGSVARPSDVARPFQGRDRGAESPALQSGGCSLQALERHIVGARRVGDVPGFEIPARYFQFLRSGDARPLAAVLEHNRLDLLTLAALTATLTDLARRGHGAARDAREALALGRVYARAAREESAGASDTDRAELDARACAALQHAVALTARTVTSEIRIDGLRMLAVVHRRRRRYADAAACWRQLLDVRGCPPQVLREAAEALAIHHEHRECDLAAAKAFALRNLTQESGERSGEHWRQAARHRLGRIERKIERTLGADRLRLD